MNSLETAWSKELEMLRLAGEVLAWKFEPMKLRLAKKTFYTPDFMVVHKDLHISFDETKGFWQDDARVKIKVAAKDFPWFKFRAIQKLAKKRGGGWTIEEF